MKTFVLTEGVTITLSNRTAHLYKDYLRIWKNHNKAVKSFCEGEMDWNDMESYDMEVEEALEKLMN